MKTDLKKTVCGDADKILVAQERVVNFEIYETQGIS
jgi:hypothetical protein